MSTPLARLKTGYTQGGRDLGMAFMGRLGSLPFTPNQMAEIKFDMPDVNHTFRRGHRIMVQVQSSWFPLADLNPQSFTDIPNAKPADFVKATERVYRSRAAASGVVVRVLR